MEEKKNKAVKDPGEEIVSAERVQRAEKLNEKLKELVEFAKNKNTRKSATSSRRWN